MNQWCPRCVRYVEDPGASDLRKLAKFQSGECYVCGAALEGMRSAAPLAGEAESVELELRRQLNRLLLTDMLSHSQSSELREIVRCSLHAGRLPLLYEIVSKEYSRLQRPLELEIVRTGSLGATALVEGLSQRLFSHAAKMRIHIILLDLFKDKDHVTRLLLDLLERSLEQSPRVDWEDVALATASLQEIGRECSRESLLRARVVDVLGKLLELPLPEGARYVVGASLADYGETSALPIVHEALRNGDDRVRFLAASTLGKAGDKSSVAFLIEALRDAQKNVRDQAEIALRQLTGHRFLLGGGYRRWRKWWSRHRDMPQPSKED